MPYPGEKDINVVEQIENPPAAAARRPMLSILTPAVHSRIRQLDWLCSKIERQIGDLAVEHLVFLDNKRRTVGEKRDALLRAARGDYVAYVDDDDDVSEDYVKELLDAIDRLNPPDVITFLQKATVNRESAIIEFKLGNQNEPFKVDPQFSFAGGRRVRRNAWHICAWRRELAIGSHFPPINYGEDWAFAEPLCAIAQTEIHIPKILHYYRHDSTTTEAPHPGVSIVNDEFHKQTGH